jgi:hypothetical protein
MAIRSSIHRWLVEPAMLIQPSCWIAPTAIGRFLSDVPLLSIQQFGKRCKLDRFGESPSSGLPADLVGPTLVPISKSVRLPPLGGPMGGFLMNDE